jgi:hypothetical protein
MGLLTEGWQKRLAVPIQPTDEALTNFSVVLTEAMMPSGVTDVLFDVTEGALTSGGDLRVSVDLDGDILVGVDLRRWNKAAGEVEIAFRVPQTSAVLTTTLYLWWGKTGASQPATGGVGGQHSAYDDDTIFCAPVGGGANRTAFNITGTDVGGITAGDIAAPSALLGTQHTDVGDYSTYGDNPDLDLVNTDWTMSFLFRATTSGQEQYILGKYDHTTQNRGYLCIFSAAQHFDLTYQPVRTSYNPIYRLSSGVDVVDGQWHHLAGTFISGTRASVYTDGILRNTTTNNIPSSVASNNAPFQIGTQVASQNRPADFSHVTVHSVARSAEWLKAENDNLRDLNSFYDAFPAPETVGGVIEVPVTPAGAGGVAAEVTAQKAVATDAVTAGGAVPDADWAKALTPDAATAGAQAPPPETGGVIEVPVTPAGAGGVAAEVTAQKAVATDAVTAGGAVPDADWAKALTPDAATAGAQAPPPETGGAVAPDAARAGAEAPIVAAEGEAVPAAARGGASAPTAAIARTYSPDAARGGGQAAQASAGQVAVPDAARGGGAASRIGIARAVAPDAAQAGAAAPAAAVDRVVPQVPDPARGGGAARPVAVDRQLMPQPAGGGGRAPTLPSNLPVYAIAVGAGPSLAPLYGRSKGVLMPRAFRIPQGDTSPAIRIGPLTRGDGSKPDLTDAQVLFWMRRDTVDGAAIVPGRAMIVEGPPADHAAVVYKWQAGDTATTGRYLAQVEVLLANGRGETFPSKGFVQIQVVPDLPGAT